MKKLTQNLHSPYVKSRLRLQSSTSLLRLSAIPGYAQEVSKYFVQIALTIQVRCLWGKYRTQLTHYSNHHRTLYIKSA